MLIGALILAGAELALADHATINATLSSTPNSGEAPLFVTHNVAVSPASDTECAQEMVSVEFGNGNSVAVFIAGNHVFNAIYTEPGDYIVMLMYTVEINHGDARQLDCQQQQAFDSVNLRVDRRLEPLDLVFSATPMSVELGEQVIFSVLGTTTDPDCYNGTEISWDFGDGETADTYTLIGRSYDKVGTFAATVSWEDGCGRIATDQATIQVQGNKAPAPENSNGSEQPNVIELDLNITVESSCSLPLDRVGTLPESCFSYTISSLDPESNVGQLQVEQSDGNLTMEFSTPSGDEFLRFNICAIRPNPTTCPPDDYCPESSAVDRCDSGDSVGISILYGDRFGVQEFSQTTENLAQRLPQLNEVSQFLNARGSAIISVLDEFSLLSQRLEENPEILAEIQELLVDNNPIPGETENNQGIKPPKLIIVNNEVCESASSIGGSVESLACSTKMLLLLTDGNIPPPPPDN